MLIFVNDSWEYKLEIYKNKDHLYYPILLKKEVFDMHLTRDREIVSESIWIEDGYTFSLDDSILFKPIEECINYKMNIISKHEEMVRNFNK